MQRALRCKSIRDGAEQCIFIAEALCELPARDPLQREMEHSSPIPNQEQYWTRLPFLLISPPISIFLCIVVFQCVSPFLSLSESECQEAYRYRFNIKSQQTAMDVYRWKSLSPAVPSAWYKSFKLKNQ